MNKPINILSESGYPGFDDFQDCFVILIILIEEMIWI
jgi:hypothetical protein